MHSATATKRLKQDYIRLRKDPVPFVTAAPLPSNLLEWRYIVEGPPDSPYCGGYYHGKLVFPPEFPFKPPAIYMITPNGRFKCNTRLCLNISDYHPETWNPAWCVSTILTGLLSFMLETHPTVGSVDTTESTKRQLAIKSLDANLEDNVVKELFPELTKKMADEVRRRNEELARSIRSDPNKRKALSRQGGEGDRPGIAQGTLTNVLVIAGFAAFAYLVRYVLKEVIE